MHPTKLLFAGDCHLTGIRAAIADAFSIHARHCTSLMASLRFFSARTTKKRELFARILLGLAPWVNNAMVSVNRCTRYIAPTRREGTISNSKVSENTDSSGCGCYQGFNIRVTGVFFKLKLFIAADGDNLQLYGKSLD